MPEVRTIRPVGSSTVHPMPPPRWLPGRLRPKAPRAVEPAPTDLDYFEDAVAR